MFALARLAQFVLGAAADHFHAVVDEKLDHVHQAQLARLAVDDGEHDDAETDLQLRVLIEVVEHHLGLFAALQLHHDAHAVAVAMVHHVGDAFDALLIDHGGDLFQQLRLIHLVRDFVDDDLVFILADPFDLGAGTNLELSAAGGVGLLETLAAQNEASGGEIRPLHEFQQLGQGGLGMLDLVDDRVDDLGKIMRRDVGGHSHGDTGGAVHQQVGDARGQNFGLGFAVVVVGFEVDGFLVQVFEQGDGDFGEAGLGVPVGGGRVAIHGAEVALAFHQRVAHGERLRQTHQGVIDGQVAVRVVLTHGVAHDAGALARGAVGLQPHLLHGVENPAVHRLEAVADIGQGASHDHAHGVIQVRALHFIFDIGGDEVLISPAATEGQIASGRRWRRWALRW